MSPEAALLDADLNHSAPAPARAEAPSPAAPNQGLHDRLAQDAPGAFEELIEAYHPTVARLAHRLLGWRGGGDVEDIVQDVFLAAFTHRRRFRGDARPSTWLMAITINRCRTRQRRWQLWRQWFARQDPAEPSSPSPLPGHDLEAGERATAVRAAVQRLAVRDREVVVLRYFEDLSSPEIAALTRQSKNAVEVRLHRARAKLSQALGHWAREEQS